MAKRKSQREIGFIQGIAYAASLAAQYDLDAHDIISESNIPVSDFRRFADESDLEHLEEVLKSIKH